MTKILALCGSIRRNSSHEKLILALKAMLPSHARLEYYQDLEQLPYFNPDLDHDPLPERVTQLRKKVSDADILFVTSPEYIHGVPGILKNALEWLVSQPDFSGKKIFLVTAGEHASHQLEEILRTMSAVILKNVILPSAGLRQMMNDDNVITDPYLLAEMKSFLRQIHNSIE